MSQLAFAAHMFVLACICHTLSCVPASADRCIRIYHILGTFGQILTWVVPLQADEMIGNEIAEAAETHEEEMIGLGFL